MSKKRKSRRFKNEDEERAFWATQDSTDFVDWTKAQQAILPDLKPSVKTISLRLPQSMYDQLKALANKHHVPYQSLIKLFLAERIRRELERDAA